MNSVQTKPALFLMASRGDHINKASLSEAHSMD